MGFFSRIRQVNIWHGKKFSHHQVYILETHNKLKLKSVNKDTRKIKRHRKRKEKIKSGRHDMKSMTQLQNISNLKIICQIWRRQTSPFQFSTIFFEKKRVFEMGVYNGGI